MAHFAKLNNDNVVEQVIVINNDILLDNGVESEQKGIDFCKSLYGQETNWKQTSYNHNFRKMFASIGSIYNEEHDFFYFAQPYPSWTLNISTGLWEPPVPFVYDANKIQTWNEETLSWDSTDRSPPPTE
jgi:hypothetical protein